MPLFRAPVVDVRLNSPMPVEDAEPVQNFTRSYYVRASSADDALLIIAQRVTQEGGQVLRIAPLVQVDGLPPELRDRAQSVGQRGIVWQSGRAFYPTD